jgi:hypothetical protein
MRFWIEFRGRINEKYKFLFKGFLNRIKNLRFLTPLNSFTDCADGFNGF